MGIEVVAEGAGFPEGPVAMPDGSVIFVELLAGRVSRAWGAGKTEVIATPGGGPNGAQLGPDGALYICNNGGTDLARGCHLDGVDAVGRIERIDLSTGKVERLYDRCDGHPLRAPNDLVFDKTGGIWFTDMGKNLERSLDFSGLYYCRPDGSAIAEAYYKGLTYNGVALSPGEDWLYVAETRTARVYKFALEGAGVIRRPPPGSHGGAASLVATVPGDVQLDSMAVTKAGNICVGTLAQGAITTITPAGKVKSFPLPQEHFVTNIAFGGRDMRTAYITLGATGKVIKTHWREPGLKLNFGLYPD